MLPSGISGPYAFRATEAKTTTEEGKQLERENLQLMLYLNLCKLMEMFARQPEKLAPYMQQSLLEVPPRKRRKSPRPPTP